MKGLKQSFSMMGLAVFFAAIFVFAGIGHALDIEIEPSNAEREVGGIVRVNIYATGATDLISMGVKVTYSDTTVLTVLSASKNEDYTEGFIMDADGDSGTTGDQYTSPPVDIDLVAGTVTMIGGRLTGSSTVGLSGKVLLGWIVFQAAANGSSDLHVDYAKYHPVQGESFDNFVNLGGSVDNPTNIPDNFGMILVASNACEGDFLMDGDVDGTDVNVFFGDFGRRDCFAGPLCEGDLDADGDVDGTDVNRFFGDFGRRDCPLPP